jgi:hypothetical protein
MQKKIKETFILRNSWYDGIKELPIEARGEMLDAIFKLHIDGTIHQFNNPIAKMLFSMIKESMEVTSNSYYQAVENGSKGGAPKGNNNAKKKQPTLDLKNNPPLNNETTVPCSKNNLIDIDIDTVIDNVTDTPNAIGSDTPNAIGSDTPNATASDNLNDFDTPNAIGSDTPTVIGSSVDDVELTDYEKKLILKSLVDLDRPEELKEYIKQLIAVGPIGLTLSQRTNLLNKKDLFGGEIYQKIFKLLI